VDFGRCPGCKPGWALANGAAGVHANATNIVANEGNLIVRISEFQLRPNSQSVDSIVRQHLKRRSLVPSSSRTQNKACVDSNRFE
jgi:hypothetical protein